MGSKQWGRREGSSSFETNTKEVSNLFENDLPALKNSGVQIKANIIMFHIFLRLYVHLVLNTLLLFFLNLFNKMVLNLGTKLCFLDKYKEV
jgi:hypothetical protein